jgi:hypothetical protein
MLNCCLARQPVAISTRLIPSGPTCTTRRQYEGGDGRDVHSGSCARARLDCGILGA